MTAIRPVILIRQAGGPATKIGYDAVMERPDWQEFCHKIHRRAVQSYAQPIGAAL